VIASLLRLRRPIVWACIAATLWLGVGAQLHGLSHALQAVQAPAHKEALVAHAQACEQCLLYAALDGAAPTPASSLPAVATASPARTAPAAPDRVAVFTAYASRAPPGLS